MQIRTLPRHAHRQPPFTTLVGVMYVCKEGRHVNFVEMYNERGGVVLGLVAVKGGYTCGLVST